VLDAAAPALRLIEAEDGKDADAPQRSPAGSGHRPSHDQGGDKSRSKVGTAVLTIS
jgi:hypothetical protein